MALVVKDRVRETSTTAGTGTLTLNGAVTGFQSFSVIGDGNTTYYTIVDAGTGAWEVGIGTYSSAGTSLSRDTVLESSNSGSLVNFGSNLKDVFVTYPAERSVYTDAAGAAITPATASVLGVASGGTGQSTYTNGQLLIGNSTGNTLTKATLTAGTGISITNGTGSITVAATNNGDVIGPASSTDNAVARFDSTTGKIIQNSGVIIDDSNNVTGVGGQTMSGNLTLNGTAQRILGDFSNATHANRVLFQTSTVDGNTNFGVIPNGTATGSFIRGYNNSDPTNSSLMQIDVSATEGSVRSGITGTGTYLPMTFHTNGVEQLRLTTGGALQFSQTGMRITGDFSNATVANRVMFQSSTTNGGTTLGIMPNGTGTTANFASYGNSADPANSSIMFVGVSGGGTEVRLNSAISGTGTYLPMTFYTGGSERMRIGTSGNVGIGTSSPAQPLVVSRGAGVAAYIQSISGTNNSVFGHGAGGELVTGSFSNQPYLFFTNSIERMRIDSAGNVGIGTSSPATRLHVDGTIRYTNRPAAGTITAIGFDANGDLKASSSSLRYKYDIEDYVKGLDTVMQLRPVSFKFNGEERTNIGFIAEEVDALGLSEVMLYNEEEQPEGVIYANMVSLLTKAIQEQQTMIDALKSEVQALKGN